MKPGAAAARLSAFALALALTTAAGRAQAQPRSPGSSEDSTEAAPDAGPGVRTVIERHLGRPYVWGASGLKSFDCSGFVWRVMNENGILVKRTTARKFYMCLPKVSEDERWEFGNIVFFSNLKHCGIVDTRESFYHASVTSGTHLSKFDPMWRRRITGVRSMPAIGEQDEVTRPDRRGAGGSPARSRR